MSCDQYRELISADLDGELRSDDEVVLFAHLGDCADCRDWRRDQLAFRTEMQQWPQEDLPDAIAAPRVAAQPTPRNVYRIPRVLAWAAAVLLIVQSTVTVTSYVTQRHDAPVAFEEADDTADTIELTKNDRTRYSVQSLPAVTPSIDPERNGG